MFLIITQTLRACMRACVSECVAWLPKQSAQKTIILITVTVDGFYMAYKLRI